jgi:hypothetical protein
MKGACSAKPKLCYAIGAEQSLFFNIPNSKEFLSDMKNISLILLCLFVILASCSTDRASVEIQKDGFSVTPKYCFANDCHNVTRATMIQLYNDPR